MSGDRTVGGDRGLNGSSGGRDRGEGRDPRGATARAGDRAGAKAAAARTLWSRSFVVIWLVNFLNSVIFLLLTIVMSKIATDLFAASPSVAGLSSSIFVIGAFITRPFLGKRIHFIGQKKTLYVGSFLAVVMTVCYFAVDSVGTLLLVRFLHGAAHSTAAMAVGTIVAGVVPRERYGEGLGYFTLGQTLSTAIGPFVGMLLLRYGGFDPIIITCAVLSAIALFVLPLSGVKDLELTAEQRAESKGFKISNYIEPRAVPVGVTLLLSYFCYSSVSSFLALYAEETRLTNAAAVFFIVYAVVIFATRPIVGRRFDARGENSVMYPSIAVFALGLAILALATHSAVLLLAAAVLGLGFGGIQACGRALTAKVTPLHRMGQATSTFYIFGDTGLGLGPLLCGLLIPFVGYRGMYGVITGVTAASLLVYHVLHGRHMEKSTPGH